MIDAIWLPQIDKELCTGCGDCVAVCPTSALAMVDGAPSGYGYAVLIEPSACSYCGHCEHICPVDAVALPYEIVLAPGLSSS